MDISNIPEKTQLLTTDLSRMAVFKNVNNIHVSYNTPIKTFEKFYINSSLLEAMNSSMNEFMADINSLVATIKDKEYVDGIYILKRDSSYQKSKLLTEDRLNTLLDEYCPESKISVDLQNCYEHSRSVATSFANSLAMTAASIKGMNAIKQSDISNTDKITEAISEIELTPAPEG